MTVVLLFGIAGFSFLLLMFAALIMLRVADKDTLIAARFEAARGQWTVQTDDQIRRRAATNALIAMQHAITELGRMVVQSGIVTGRTRAELQQTLSSAGFRGNNALALFIGTKLALLFGLPAIVWVVTQRLGFASVTGLLFTSTSAVIGLVGPDTLLKRRRNSYLKRLERGISDALDLMVICAQAGLSLEPAMARVANEMRDIHPEISLEFATTVRELEMSDSAAALANLGRRTGLESLVRLTATLTQSMQYGTPLSQALRNLSNEMRGFMLTKFEERAARLPVLLTLPMILFVLPCVFLIVGGPAGIQIGRSLSGG